MASNERFGTPFERGAIVFAVVVCVLVALTIAQMGRQVEQEPSSEAPDALTPGT